MNAYELIAPTAGEAAALDAAKAERKAAAEQAASKAKRKATAAARAAAKAERKAAEAVMLARRLAIRDGAAIWVDAVGYGRDAQVSLRVDTDAGSYTATALGTAGVWGGRRGETYSRTSAECYAVLKAVELACECGLKHCVIRSDSIEEFGNVPTRRGCPGTKYLRVAEKMAQAAGLEVEFEMCAGSENLADAVSRR